MKSKVVNAMDSEWFAGRLFELRNQKNISARDMSLSLGQSESYINKIENQKALPSMNMFFYICEFLDVTPGEFFSEDVFRSRRLEELTPVLDNLSLRQLDALQTFLEAFQKK